MFFPPDEISSNSMLVYSIVGPEQREEFEYETDMRINYVHSIYYNTCYYFAGEISILF